MVQIPKACRAVRSITVMGTTPSFLWAIYFPDMDSVWARKPDQASASVPRMKLRQSSLMGVRCKAYLNVKLQSIGDGCSRTNSLAQENRIDTLDSWFQDEQHEGDHGDEPR